MAFTLDLTYTQQSDAKALRFDDSTTEDANGWDVGNITVDLIDGSYDPITETRLGTYTLELYIDITTSDGATTSYDGIDLYTTFGPGAPAVWADPTELVFDINCSHLKEAGVAIGDSDDELPDGIWNIVYQVYQVGVGIYVAELEENILVDGVVRNKVYDQLREIPDVYSARQSSGFRYSKDFGDVLDALLKYSIFKGMLATVSDGTQNKVLEILTTLENLTVND